MKTLIAFLLLGAAYGYPGKRSAAADEGPSYLRGEYERNDDEGHENALGNYEKREAEAEADPGRKRGNKCSGKREAEPGCYRGKREAEAEAIPGRKRVYKPKCRGKREADPGCYRGKRDANAEPAYISRKYGGYGYSGYGIGGGYYGKREAN